MTDHIAFYGKGGVGTSTLISNVSAALVEAGFRVLQVGCGVNGDSCNTLNGGVAIPTVWGQNHQNSAITFDTVVNRGFKGIYCIELSRHGDAYGGYEPVRALDLLLEHDLISSLNPDFVFYDISGVENCMLMTVLGEKVNLHRVFAVTSADFMSLTAVNTIIEQLEQYAGNHVPIHFGGLIPNGISSSFEESFISDFALKTDTRTLGRIPRSQMVRQCELYGKTVIEASPLSNQSYFYRRLANQIADELHRQASSHLPKPLNPDQLRSWARDWADRLFALENGLVSDGAAI